MNREVIIWDDKPERAARLQTKLASAGKALKIRIAISVQSEPPLIARQNLCGQTPAFEIKGAFWRLGPGKEPNQAAIERLLQKLFCV